MSDTEKAVGEEPNVPNADGISEAVNKLMAHPELISAVASALGGMQGGAPSPPPTERTADTEETVQSSPTVSAAPDIQASLSPLLSKLTSQSGGVFRHEALLCALKPYLSPSRKEAIEYIIKISKMSNLVKGLK